LDSASCLKWNFAFSYVTASMGLYAPLIMKAILSPDAQARALSLNVADLLLEQGIVHPVEVDIDYFTRVYV
jgi:hypothetical protein